MKKINKLIGLLFILIGFVTLASCSGAAGVKGVMEAKATSNKVTITCTFEANSKLESGDAKPVIRQYSYEDGEVKATSDDYRKVTFEKSNTVASVVFDGLTPNTKYLYKMYINYDSTDTYITEIEVTTLSYDDEKPIEISTKEDFLNMADDSDGIYVLKNDIDFGGEEIDLFSSETEPFKGTFNGDNHKITNVKLSASPLNYYGIFGYTKNAKISNLNVENVTIDSSSNGSFSSGALVGYAEATSVSNVTIKSVNYTIAVSTNGDVNIGGVVGTLKNSTFTNTTAENVTINFTQARYKVNVGLFAGKISGPATITKTIDGKEKTIDTDQCSVTGEIKGDMKFTSSTEGYLRAGGFVGFVEASSSLIYNSYCDAKIAFTKTDSTDKFNLSIGGFVGANNGGVNISKCFAKTDIQACAGEVAVTSTTPSTVIDELNNNIFVAEESDMIVAIGGFAGRFNRTIGEISNCYFIGNVEVYAKATRKASSNERTTLESETGEKIKDLSVGEIRIVNGIQYEITGETEYYTYDSDNDEYVKATDVDPNNFPTNKYYTKSGDDYTLATSYTPKEVTATYLAVDELCGLNLNSATHTAEAIVNVDKYQSTSDTSVFESFVKTFIDTIIL